MAAAPNGQFEPGLPGEPDHLGGVGVARDAHDRDGPLVDPAVEERAGLVVAGSSGPITRPSRSVRSLSIEIVVIGSSSLGQDTDALPVRNSSVTAAPVAYGHPLQP